MYTKGLLYFIGHDPRMPAALREQMLQWGYPADEYKDNDNRTPQLDVRESRRMKGAYVMTQSNCEGKTKMEDGVAMAAYTMDSQNCERIVITKNGMKMVKNEGNVEIGGFGPYPVSYRSIIPQSEECSNLLVPPRRCYGPSMLVSDSASGQEASVQFYQGISKPGRYRIYTYLPRLAGMAEEIPVVVFDGKNSHPKNIHREEIRVAGQTSGEWILLGEFDLVTRKAPFVKIYNDAKRGAIAADAVLLRLVEWFLQNSFLKAACLGCFLYSNHSQYCWQQ